MKTIRYKGITIYKDKPTKDGRCYFFKKYKNGKHYTSPKYRTTEEVEKAYSLFVLKNDNPINKRFDLVSEDYFNNLINVCKETTFQTYLYDYNKHIKPFFENKYINKITTADINIWAEKLQKQNYSTKYLNKIKGILKNIFNYGIKFYQLENNPVISFGSFKKLNKEKENNFKEVNYITKEEFEKFISVIEDDMWKTWFITSWYTGCRKSELRALTWNNIDFNQNYIHIKNNLNDRSKSKKITSTKTGKERFITMNSRLKQTLFEYKKKITKYTDFSNDWLVFGNTNYLSRNLIDRKKDYYFDKSGVKRITNHEFRHSIITHLVNTYIQNCIKKGINIDSDRFFIMLATRDGHSVETLKRVYMHLFPSTQNEIVDMLNDE